MKQIIASVYFDVLLYTIGNIIFCIFLDFRIKFNNNNCKGIQLPLTSFLVSYQK